MQCVEELSPEALFDLDEIEAPVCVRTRTGRLPALDAPDFMLDLPAIAFTFAEVETSSATACTYSVTVANLEAYDGVLCYAQSPDGLDVYKINVSYTTYWAVDTPGGGVEMYHYSGKSWNQGSGQWRVFWKDQAEVGRFQDPSAFLQEYFPDMPRTPDSIRKLADSWRGKRYKKTCDEDAAVLQKFQEAEKNEANLFYNAFGIGADNCSSFGKTIMKQALPTVPK